MENPIGYFRTMRGMSQSQLAQKAGVSLGGLKKLEQGERSVMKAQLGNVLQLTRALGITAEELAAKAEE